MDGYHLYRKDLNEEGIKYRGAVFTFDLQSFKKKIQEIKLIELYESSSELNPANN